MSIATIVSSMVARLRTEKGKKMKQSKSIKKHKKHKTKNKTPETVKIDPIL